MTERSPRRGSTPEPTRRADPEDSGLRVLVVDDEDPAREELAYLLRLDSRVGRVSTASSGAEALKALEAEPVDALFLDIKMPGLDGLDIARVLARFVTPPSVVFVTAYDGYAVEAFALEAADYLLKPVRQERLAEAVRRVATGATAAPAGGSAPESDESIAVELAGVTRFIKRSEVAFVTAHGDYARLHTRSDSHLLRIPLATLEERWAAAGFVRIHRRHLVALGHIDEVRIDGGRWTVRLGSTVLAVSRRHSRELRDLLISPGRGQPVAEPARQRERERERERAE